MPNILILGSLAFVELANVVTAAFICFATKFNVSNAKEYFAKAICPSCINALAKIIIFAPFVLHPLMSFLSYIDPSLSTHFAVGLLLLGYMGYSLFLGLGHWYSMSYKTSFLFYLAMIISILCFWLYLFVVVYLPQYYSYSGATSIYLALNFFFSFGWSSHSFYSSNLKISTLLIEFLSTYTSKEGGGVLNPDDNNNPKAYECPIPSERYRMYRGREAENPYGWSNEKYVEFTKEIIEKAKLYSIDITFPKRCRYFVLSLITLIAYILTSYFWEEAGHKLVPLINALFVLMADIIIFIYCRYTVQEVNIYHNGIVMLLYRFALVFTINYWALGITVSYLIVGVYLISRFITILFPNIAKSDNGNKDLILPRISLGKFLKGISGFIIITMVFIFVMFIAMVEFKEAKLRKITFTNAYDQYLFGIVAAACLVAFLFCRLWYKSLDFSIKKSLVYALVFCSFMLLIGIYGYYQIDNQPFILLSSFSCFAPIGLLGLLFFRIWRGNDFSFYFTETVKNEIRQENQDESNFQRHPLKISDKTILPARQLPAEPVGDNANVSTTTLPPKLSYSLIIIQFFLYSLVIIYGTLTSIYFKPYDVGYTIAAWILFIWFFFLAGWNYIGARHEWRKAVIVHLILGWITFFLWAITFFVVTGKIVKNDSTSYTIMRYFLFIAFCLIYFAFNIFGVICFVDSGYQNKSIVKVTIAISFIFGVIASLCLWQVQLILPAISLVICIDYSIYLYTLKASRENQQIGKCKIFLLYFLFLIQISFDTYFTFMRSTNAGVATLTLIACSIFFIYAIYKYVESAKNGKEYIRVYGKLLFPIYKYSPEKNKMEPSNYLTGILLSAIASVIMGGFMISIFSDIEYRYIGLCISSAAIGKKFKIYFLN